MSGMTEKFFSSLLIAFAAFLVVGRMIVVYSGTLIASVVSGGTIDS